MSDLCITTKGQNSVDDIPQDRDTCTHYNIDSPWYRGQFSVNTECQGGEQNLLGAARWVKDFLWLKTRLSWNLEQMETYIRRKVHVHDFQDCIWKK